MTKAASPPADKLRAEPDVERQLIARVMYGSKGKIPEPPTIPPSRFAVESHRLIWSAILDQHRKTLPYDVVSVAQLLEERGELSRAGGKAYLAGIEPYAGTADSLDYYVAILTKVAAVRTIAGLGRAITELGFYDPERPLASIKARYQALVRRADAICDIASRNGHAASLITRTIHEIMTSPAPPVDWVYEPWLGAGDVVILAGEPGLGKSWVALDLMFALALGRPWATHDPTTAPQRVLYLDEENNYRLVRHRIGKLVDGYDIGMRDIDPASLGAAYALEQGVNLDDSASLDLLRRKLDQLRPDWIIIDSLVRIHRRDENSNAEMSALIGGVIKPLAQHVGAGVIIVHHLGKATKERPAGSIAERIRGASDIRAVADQVWGLERRDDGLLLTHIKCRMDRESSPLAVSLDDVHLGNGLRITYEAQDMDSADLIEQAITEAGPAGIERPTLIQILDSAGMRQAARLATRHLGSMHASGKIRKRRDGRSVRYWPSNHAPSDSE